MVVTYVVQTIYLDASGASMDSEKVRGFEVLLVANLLRSQTDSGSLSWASLTTRRRTAFKVDSLELKKLQYVGNRTQVDAKNKNRENRPFNTMI